MKQRKPDRDDSGAIRSASGTPVGSGPAPPDATATDVVRYRHLVEQARDIIFQADPDGYFTYVNPVASRIMGYPVERLIGMHFLALVREDFRAEMRDLYLRQIRDRIPTTYHEFPAVTADGRELWIGQNVQLVTEGDAVVGVQAVARDLTERRAMERAVRATDARRRAILEASLDCIVTIDDAGRVLEFNPAAERTFGYRREDAVGRRVSELMIPPRYRATHDRALADYGKPGTGLLVGKRVERRAVRADGTEFPIEIAVIPIVQEDGTRVFTAVIRDITDRKRAEAELIEARDAAERSARATSALLTTMSHEIRTPLNAILGTTELLLDRRLDSETTELATIIQSSGRTLLVLLSAFLDTAKLEAGRLELESKPFDPRDVVDDVADTLGAAAVAKGIELVAYVEPTVPCTILGDPVRLRQVLLNIADNAVKYTDEGGVTIHVQVDAATGGQPGRELHLTITDSGIGISPADQARIFEPFAQLSAGARRRTGTGLGLGISRSLVTMMGGRIELDSAPGHGSTFHVRLPLRVPSSVGLPDPRPQPLSGIAALVLVPRGTLRDMVVSILRHSGAEVEVAASPDDAVAALRAADRPPVALVADDRSLGPPGVRRLVRAMTDTVGPRTKLVLLCARDPRECSGAGARNVIPVRRPVRPRALVQAVEAARSRRRRFVPASSHVGIPTVARPGARVLLVKGNREDRTVAARVLAAAQCDVDTASDGRRAVAMTRATRYDVILVDMHLPSQDGLGVAREIRAAEQASGQGPVPIIGLTTLVEPGTRDRCAAEGMADCLKSPVAAPDLVRAVSRLLDPRPAVLVADDSADERTMIQRMLQDGPYRLVTVADGREAVEAFESQGFAFVVLDVEMPVMNGFEAARAIRLTRHGALVPIVALTGHTSETVRQQCLEAGFTGYLTKPISRAELLRLIAESITARPSLLRSPRPSGAVTSAAGDGPRQVPRLGRTLEPALDAVRAKDVQGDLPGLAVAAQEAAARADGLALPHLTQVLAETAATARSGDESAAGFWLRRVEDELQEGARVLAVREAGLLDVHPDTRRAFDHLTRFAATALGAPVALLTAVDDHRQVFSSQSGLAGSVAAAGETSLAHSFCRFVVLSREPLVVDDAREHPLVRQNLAVRDLGVAAYAGVPIVTREGFALGSFCAVDTQPRRWTANDVWLLRTLAAYVAAELDVARRTPGDTPLPPPHMRIPTPDAAPPPHIADLVPGFLANRRADAQRIPELLERDDLAEITRLGHNMKSSAAGYGFPEMSRIGRGIEVAAAAVDRPRIRQLAAELAAHLSLIAPEPRPAEADVVGAARGSEARGATSGVEARGATSGAEAHRATRVAEADPADRSMRAGRSMGSEAP